MRLMPQFIKRFAGLASRREGGLAAPSAEAIADPEILRLFLRLEELKRLDNGFDIPGAE